MPSVKHVHKLRKHKYPSGSSVFFCTLEECHYKIEVPLSVGKESLCNICGNPFIMNEYTLKLAKPHCTACGKVAVKDMEGRIHYVRKQKTPILANVAEDNVNELRSRLQTAVSGVAEDDI